LNRLNVSKEKIMIIFVKLLGITLFLMVLFTACGNPFWSDDVSGRGGKGNASGNGGGGSGGISTTEYT